MARNGGQTQQRLRPRHREFLSRVFCSMTAGAGSSLLLVFCLFLAIFCAEESGEAAGDQAQGFAEIEAPSWTVSGGWTMTVSPSESPERTSASTPLL
jgi:hypothetical protein